MKTTNNNLHVRFFDQRYLCHDTRIMNEQPYIETIIMFDELKRCTITTFFTTTYQETEPFSETVFKERLQIKNYPNVFCLRGAAAALLS